MHELVLRFGMTKKLEKENSIGTVQRMSNNNHGKDSAHGPSKSFTIERITGVVKHRTDV